MHHYKICGWRLVGFESMTWEFVEIEMVRKTHPTLLNGVPGSLVGLIG
jgi:hypothetical protein